MKWVVFFKFVTYEASANLGALRCLCVKKTNHKTDQSSENAHGTEQIGYSRADFG